MMSIPHFNPKSPSYDWRNESDPNASKQPTQEEAQRTYNHSAPILVREMNKVFVKGTGLNDVGLKQIAENGEITANGEAPLKFSPEAQEAARKLMELGGFSKIFNGEKDYYTTEDLVKGYAHGIPFNESWGDKLINEIR